VTRSFCASEVWDPVSTVYSPPSLCHCSESWPTGYLGNGIQCPNWFTLRALCGEAEVQSSLRDFVWIYQPCVHCSPQHYLGMSTGGEVSESGPVCTLPLNKPSTAPVLHFAHAPSSPSHVTLTWRIMSLLGCIPPACASKSNEWPFSVWDFQLVLGQWIMT
jgi:hypothetical protein